MIRLNDSEMELQTFKDILTKSGFTFSKTIKDVDGLYNMEDWIKHDLEKEQIITVRIFVKIDGTEEFASFNIEFTNPDKWEHYKDIGLTTKGYSTFLMSYNEIVEQLRKRNKQ